MDTTETNIYTAVVTSAFVICFVLLYFAVILYRGRIKYFRLLAKQLLAEMDVLERERTRIARDLHDDIGPMLAVTKIQLEQLLPSSVTKENRPVPVLQNLVTITERLGEIALNLTPKLLQRKGLETALNDFVDQFSTASGIAMQLDYHVKSRISAEYALHIYRIVQELIHNAVKHSEASHVHIQLKEHKQKLYLFYTDNGKGFDVSMKQDRTTGLGLGSLQNRALLLGGKMTRTKSKGTDYVFEIPIRLDV